MANTVEKTENGFGMSNAEIQKLVERELKWKTKALRNKIKAKLLKAKIEEAGITVTDAEIDAEIAKMEK
ncbi:MAG: SurA N-terminal domain-containing protein [Thermodesulfobacteriota bacterium]